MVLVTAGRQGSSLDVSSSTSPGPINSLEGEHCKTRQKFLNFGIGGSPDVFRATPCT